MLNPDLDEYKKQYDKFIELMVEFHNLHQYYIHNLSQIKVQKLKSTLRKLRSIEKEMIVLAHNSFQNHKRGLAEAKKLRKQATERKKKLTPPIRTRKEKTNESNDSRIN